MDREAFLTAIHSAAINAGHPYPEITAAEAAYESDFGTSAPATRANNVFNLRSEQGFEYPYPRIKLFHPLTGKRGQQLLLTQHYVLFPDVETCLRVRHEYLQWKSLSDARITEALRIATEPQTSDSGTRYIAALSNNVASASDRAERVLSTLAEYSHLFAAK